MLYGTPTGFTYSNATTASLGVTTNTADCGAHQFRVLIGSAGCQATSTTATLTVLKATRLAPIGQQCTGTALNFDACPAGATYSWSVTAPAGTSATPTNGTGQTFSFTPTNTTLASQTYTVNASITFGGLTCSQSFVPTVVPPAEAGTLSGTASVCIGGTSTLTSNGMTGGTWTSSNTSIATVNASGVITGVAAGSATITYTVNGSGSCTGSDIATLSITVTPGPEAGTLSGNATVCVGSTTTITSNGDAGGTWTYSNTSIATVNASGVVTGVAAGSATITYTVNGSGSCTGSDIATVSVTVNQGAGVSFSANQSSGCAPLTVTFTSNANSGSCVWDLGNGQTLTGCTASYTFTQQGCYDISLSSTENGCVSSLTQDDFICVDNSPIAAFTSSLTIFNEPIETVILTNNSVGASTYLWNFGDGQSSTAINPSHTFQNASFGTFIELIAYSTAGCSDTAILFIGFEPGEVFYVPNSFTPDGDEYNNVFFPVFYSGYDPYNYELLIFDRWGELIFESHNVLEGWDGSYGNKGRKAQDGTYIWKITFKNLLNNKRRQVVGHVNLNR